MNCQDISSILDERDIARLDATVLDAARSHLNTCAGCAGDWEAHARLVDQSLPRLPGSLPQRIWQSIPSSGEPRSRTNSRTVLFAAWLLVGAAAAMLATWSGFEPRPQGFEIASDTASTTANEPSGTETAAPEAIEANTAVSRTAAPEPAQDGESQGIESAGRRRLSVLPVRLENADPLVSAYVEAARRSMVRELGVNTNFEIVDVGAAELDAIWPNGAGPLSADAVGYLAVVHQFGSDCVAEVSVQSRDGQWLIGMNLRAGSGTASIAMGIRAANGRLQPDPDVMGATMASRIEQQISRSFSRGQDAFTAIVLDATRTDDERIEALLQMHLEDFGSDVIAAVTELGSQSESAHTRAQVWSALHENVYDPTLAQPLSYALLSDPDARVRKEAALALEAYRDEDGSTLPALEYAEANDVSADVRLAARLAAMSFDEQQVFERETLLDSSLTPAARLAPALLKDHGTIQRQLDSRDSETLRAYAEIVAETDDLQLKLTGLSALLTPFALNAIDPDIVDVLLESLEHDDRRVRLAAARALTRRVEDAKVRAALEAALEDEPELAAEAGVAEALARPLPESLQSR